MAVGDEIISQPESVIKKPQLHKTINVNEREKQLKDQKSGVLSALSKKKDIAIFGKSLIKHIKGYEHSKKIVRCLPGSNVRCMKNQMKTFMREKADLPYMLQLMT